MQIIHSDNVFKVESGSPDYNQGNSLLKLLALTERVRLAAELEQYFMGRTQYLFPFDFLELYGPSGADKNILDPTEQDNKSDFQKQNVRNFTTTDTRLVRGLATAGDWAGPFLRVSYRGGPDSRLSEIAGHNLGERIKLWIKVGGAATPTLVSVPYNPATDFYEVEFWGYPGANLSNLLDEKGRAALASGELQTRPDLLRGTAADFDRDNLNDKDVREIAPDNSMHPVLPLHVELAWADESGRFWDSKNGANYHYEFNMILRGWDNFLSVGISPNPHGGVGFLEYRNLASNYNRFAGSRDLGRDLEAWNFDAFGGKNHGNRRENFLAVDYMDSHILKPHCGIGLHRHRDNQEVFLMMNGRGLMVVGDWCKMPERERCFEIRTLRSGHFAMLKGGNLHALMNTTDEDIFLFMFGGYD